MCVYVAYCRHRGCILVVLASVKVSYVRYDIYLHSHHADMDGGRSLFGSMIGYIIWLLLHLLTVIP